MIDFISLRDDLRLKLQNYLREEYEDLLVINMNPDAPQPPTPYITMDWTSPYIPRGEGIYTLEDKNDDLEEARYSNDEMSASFNIYSDDRDEAHKVALWAARYFLFDGLSELKEDGLIVIDVSGIQNRDTYVVDEWERRLGFDVTFRILSKVKRTTGTIETVGLER